MQLLFFIQSAMHTCVYSPAGIPFWIFNELRINTYLQHLYGRLPALSVAAACIFVERRTQEGGVRVKWGGHDVCSRALMRVAGSLFENGTLPQWRIFLLVHTSGCHGDTFFCNHQTESQIIFFSLLWWGDAFVRGQTRSAHGRWYGGERSAKFLISARQCLA
jgi:hypothetical protein